MKKIYYCYIESCNNISGTKYHYEELGFTPKEALKKYNLLKSKDFYYGGNDFHHTNKIKTKWVFEPIKNNYHFYKKEKITNKTKTFEQIEGFDEEENIFIF